VAQGPPGDLDDVGLEEDAADAVVVDAGALGESFSVGFFFRGFFIY